MWVLSSNRGYQNFVPFSQGFYEKNHWNWCLFIFNSSQRWDNLGYFRIVVHNIKVFTDIYSIYMYLSYSVLWSSMNSHNSGHGLRVEALGTAVTSSREEDPGPSNASEVDTCLGMSWGLFNQPTVSYGLCETGVHPYNSCHSIGKWWLTGFANSNSIGKWWLTGFANSNSIGKWWLTREFASTLFSDKPIQVWSNVVGKMWTEKSWVF